MLKNLKIENYALIENLNIDFTDGLSVITGETGAGKSIIIGALSLVLGHRADSKVILSDSGKCVVEATFDISAYRLQEFFDMLELDYATDTIVRREILANGKSRAFINDTPVNLQQLKELISNLIDIHSQHENLMLSNADFQLNIVDTVASTSLEISEYRKLFDQYQEQKHRLKEIEEEASLFVAEKDYAEHQLKQLQEAQLVENEQDELEQELKLINHSQEITEKLFVVLQLLDREEVGVVSVLKSSSQKLHKLRDYLDRVYEFAERINTALIDIKDIASEIESILGNTEFSIERKTFVEDRLNLIYSLQQKHRVDNIYQLLEIQSNLEQKLNLIENFDEEILKLKKRIYAIETELIKAANILTNKRKEVRVTIVEQTEQMLHDLSMPNGRFDIDFRPLEGFTSSGCDKIEFLFSANKNREPQSITSIASGGEISRLMLIIKSLVTTSKALPTIIFDEIDTGISGEIAKKMGEIMEKMADNMQIITITHLPQIASKGGAHYKVYKQDIEEKTQTNIIRLSDKERIIEIAEMIAGKNPSASALESAKEMLRIE